MVTVIYDNEFEREENKVLIKVKITTTYVEDITWPRRDTRFLFKC